MNEQPLCAHCSEPIQKLIHRWVAPDILRKNTSIAPQPKVGEKDQWGQTVLKIIEEKYLGSQIDWVAYWTGKWEHEGIFCSKECGYRRGLKMIQEIRGRR